MPMLRALKPRKNLRGRGRVRALAFPRSSLGDPSVQLGQPLPSFPISMAQSPASQSLTLTHQSLWSWLSLPLYQAHHCHHSGRLSIQGACPTPWPFRASTASSPMTSFLLDSTPDSLPQGHTWDLVIAHFQNNSFKPLMRPACKWKPREDFGWERRKRFDDPSAISPALTPISPLFYPSWH